MSRAPEEANPGSVSSSSRRALHCRPYRRRPRAPLLAALRAVMAWINSPTSPRKGRVAAGRSGIAMIETDRQGKRQRTVTLRDERQGRDCRHLWAYVDDAGCLHIDGQDLGPGTAPVSDDGEYEWFQNIKVEDLPRLLGLLGGNAGDDILALLEEKGRARTIWSGSCATTRYRSSGTCAETTAAASRPLGLRRRSSFDQRLRLRLRAARSALRFFLRSFSLRRSRDAASRTGPSAGVSGNGTFPAFVSATNRFKPS